LVDLFECMMMHVLTNPKFIYFSVILSEICNVNNLPTNLNLHDRV